MQSAYRAGHANVLATQGNIREAETLFEEAEQRQVQVGLELPYLYSAAGFQYISFLLRSVAPSAFPSLAQRVQETRKIAERNDHLLDIGLNSPLKKALLTGFHSTAKHNATKAVSPSSETMRTI